MGRGLNGCLRQRGQERIFSIRKKKSVKIRAAAGIRPIRGPFLLLFSHQIQHKRVFQGYFFQGLESS